MYTLENNQVKVIITNQAAEIISFIDKSNDIDIIWSANPEYWSQRNPLLFPQIGNTIYKYYYTKSNKYSMGNHGFSRHSTFDYVESTDTSLVLCLKDNDITYSQYPYHFRLYVTYNLIGKRLDISYKVINDDECMMPFAIGLHPAFNNIDFNNSKLIFEKNEKDIVDKTLLFNYDLFIKDSTLIYSDLNSNYVILDNNKSKIKICIKDYKHLAIWTPKTNAPMICIEPWKNLPNNSENIVFEEYEDMIKLNSSDQYNMSYYIEIE